MEKSQTLTIGIIGAGFSGVALAATIHRLNPTGIKIYLFEKTGAFAAGDAYRTPYPFHLLNIRAEDMSAFEDEPLHFVDWIAGKPQFASYIDPKKPIRDQFMPRLCYGAYLRDLLSQLSAETDQWSLSLVADEVIDVALKDNQSALTLKQGGIVCVDKVILALGSHPPHAFPFPLEHTRCIRNPWDYRAPEQIAPDESVLIVGTGLSMVDVLLTLHYQKHQGKIFALSRHGLIPLSHGPNKARFLSIQDELPRKMSQLMRQIRKKSKHHMDQGDDWRSVMNALRLAVPTLWCETSLQDKKRFLRHVLPYWNIHRHRVQDNIFELLLLKSHAQQFELLSGRIVEINNNLATIRLRHTGEIKQINTQWVINCMGPSLNTTSADQPLLASLLKQKIATLDPLGLGLMTSSMGALKDHDEKFSSLIYVLGSLRKGMVWESTSVPSIRQQTFKLAKHLLDST